MHRARPKEIRLSGWARKATALLEVMGVFIGGSFAAGYLAPFLGIHFPDFGALQPDFVVLSVDWLKFFLFQYACLLSPAFAIGWWRRRLGPRHYGLTRAGQRTATLIAQGVIAFAAVGLLIKLLWLARQFISLGPEPAFWRLIDHADWTLTFWLFLAVSSFAVTPALEELFFRGYCQTRLEENFGGMGSIVIVALFLALGHNQYHHLNVLSIGSILSGILCFLGMGWLYWRSRSLIPGLIIHGALNLPTKAMYDFLPPAAMIVVLIVFRKDWLGMMREFRGAAAASGWKHAAFWGTAFSVAMVLGYETHSNIFVPSIFLGLAAALAMEFSERRTTTDERHPLKII